MFFYAIMGIAVSAFGVVNTLSMSVLEQAQKIEVLRAIGTTRLQVGRLILDEGVVISVIGCTLGVVLGSLLGYLFVRGSSAAGFEVAFHYPTVPALLALLIGVSAGLLPARSAARTNIVEAVQYEWSPRGDAADRAVSGRLLLSTGAHQDALTARSGTVLPVSAPPTE